MHEMALCESLIAIIEEQAASGGFRQVHSISLEVGALAGVETEALLFGFRAISQGTIAQDAELKILAATAQAHCLLCGFEETVSRPVSLCPACGGGLHMTGDRALRIKEMEVE